MLGYDTEGDGAAGIQRRLSEHDIHHRAFSLAGEDMVGGPPSGVRRRSVCRRSTDKAKILLLGARTQNGGFDMIRYAFYAYALLLAKRQTRRTTAEIPEYHYAWFGSLGPILAQLIECLVCLERGHRPQGCVGSVWCCWESERPLLVLTSTRK
ncbi:hypothetical protein BDP81DRAFT_100226 [Colletotrichum phormii]|uniref:Uncharacterized protein n=1 Tax=Colletotrichum phormii TaxID=359342 RepID=A0AAJ0EBL3_9PEZI|nr:uncharacterized protein BDP81DRAFT_100226 [Colletotrichum phormii]KAK1625200.1 hypothetical protein BDP81DRAFT_100226 [Colletotrichum phormii]